MTTSATPPQLTAKIGRLERRITDLENYLLRGRGADRPDTTFVLAGGLYLTTSPRYPSPRRRAYWQAAVDLTDPSTSGPVTVVVAVGGVAQLTLTVPQGLTAIVQPIEMVVSAEGKITCEITDAGVGATDLVVALRF